MTQKRISVLLPFHRLDNFFKEAIHSLDASSIPISIILIDDRISKSESLHPYLKSLRNEFQLVSTLGGKGYGRALSIGADIADADFIALFNSDDLMAPNRFERQLATIGNADLSFTNIQGINQKGKFRRSLLGTIKESPYDNAFLLLGSYGANASWLAKKSWWHKNAFFDEDECLDWRIALRNFDKSKVSYLPESLYFYRSHRLQITQNRAISKSQMSPVYKEWLRFAKSLDISYLSYETFCFFSIPWNKSKIQNLSEIDGFYLDFLRKNKESKSLRIFESLLQRRYLLNLRNSGSFSEKFSLLSAGSGQIRNLSLDLLGNFVSNHVIN
jgi:glycosyltransferase involved in cell wall biosynthesis